MKKEIFQYIIFFILLFCLSSCALLSNSDGIKTLMDYAQEQKDLSQDLLHQNALFDELVSRIHKGESFEQKTQFWFLREFGVPIFKKVQNPQGIVKEIWLYRYALASQAKERVYIVFSQEGLLEDVIFIDNQK